MESIRIPIRGRQDNLPKWVLVDMDDYERLAVYNWFPTESHGKVYAVRNNWDGEHKTNKRIRMHREIMGLEPGDKRSIDHINGDTLDNRKANLRAVSHQENRQNTKGWANSSSAHRGVSWDKARGLWRAQCKVHGKQIAVGRFKTEEEANEAVIAFRREHMPYSTI